MSVIHIHRPHQLGLTTARELARQWATKAEQKLEVRCTYHAGEEEDTVSFTRAGIDGTLQVRGDALTLQATLGFFFAAFQPQIEAQIDQQLTALLQKATAAPAAPNKSPRVESAHH